RPRGNAPEQQNNQDNQQDQHFLHPPPCQRHSHRRCATPYRSYSSARFSEICRASSATDVSALKSSIVSSEMRTPKCTEMRRKSCSTVVISRSASKLICRSRWLRWSALRLILFCFINTNVERKMASIETTTLSS